MSDLSGKLPPLGTLVVFEAAVRLKSFSRAADECALSQASVSRQIRQLEENLSVQLFDRHRYDVTATEAGLQFYDTVRRALLELGTTADTLRKPAASGNQFTIYSDLSIAMNVLAPALEPLRQQFPDYSFNILSSYDPIEKAQAGFDLGLQTSIRAEHEFNHQTIANDIVFPVCSPELALSCKPEISARDLSKLNLLHLEYGYKNSMGWPEFLADFGVTFKRKPEQLVLSSYQVSLDVAEQGDGVVLGWARSVSNKLRDGKLVRLSELAVNIENGIVVHQRKNEKPHAISDAVIEIIQANLLDINGWL